MNFQCDLHFDSKLYSKLYLCNMSFLPFPFLWFLLISSRIKGFRWVSLISFSSSKHCLPPRTTAAQVLQQCQICREGRISYSRTNLRLKKGAIHRGRRYKTWPILTHSYQQCIVFPYYIQKYITEQDCVLTKYVIVFNWVESSTHLSTPEIHQYRSKGQVQCPFQGNDQ